jgi:hypothetical protein
VGRGRLRGHRHTGHPRGTGSPPPQRWRQRSLEREPDDPRPGTIFLCQPGCDRIGFAELRALRQRQPLRQSFGGRQPDGDGYRQRLGDAMPLAERQL